MEGDIPSTKTFSDVFPTEKVDDCTGIRVDSNGITKDNSLKCLGTPIMPKTSRCVTEYFYSSGNLEHTGPHGCSTALSIG